MAQIIKHRRGGISTLKDVTARKGELVIATGSIGDMNGPWVFIGDTEGVAGAYKATSKIYQGGNAPTVNVGTYGSTIDGTPFYASNNETLYILSSAGNTTMDLTGNIEGNLISGVTINNLTGVTSTFSTYVSASALNVQNNTQVLGNLGVSGTTSVNGATTLNGSTTINNNLTVTGTTSISGSTTIDNTLDVTGNTDLEANLTVSGTTTISGATQLLTTFNVDGQSTLASVNVEDLTDNRIIIAGASGELEDDANLTFDGTTFKVGNGGFEVDSATGNLRTSGSITMKGNITIGDNLTGDTINLNAEISSSLIPSGSNVFDLGSTSNYWKDLYISGTANINVLNANTISLSGITVFDDLEVQGNSFLGNSTGDTVQITGSVYLQSLTEKRLVVVGADGLLTDYSGLTFDNGNLNLSGALEVTNIQGTGSLYLKPDLNDSRDFRIYNTAPSDIHIKGNAAYSFFGDDSNFLKIDDNTNTITIDSLSGVTIDIDTTVSQSLSVDGHINLTGTRQIRVTDDTANTIYGFYDGSSILGSYYQMFGNNYSTATQRGGAEFVFDSRNSGTGGFNISEYNGSTWLRKLLIGTSTIGLTGTTTISGDLTITGTTEAKGAVGINSTLDVTGSAKLNSTLEVVGNTSLDGTLEVTGSAKFKSSAEVVGNTTLNGTLEVTGSATFKDAINVTGTTTLGGAANLNNTLTVVNTSEFKSAVGINSTLDVTGSAQFMSTINVDSEATLASATVEDLTQYRVVVAGSGGSLEDYTGLTFNGTTLKIGGGQLEIDNADGNLRTSGSLTVNNGMTINGNQTVNGVLTVTGNTQLQSNLYVSGNLEVLGSATNVTIQSTTIELDDNIIRLNAYSPFERYAGFEVIDSGSSGVSASLVWDSLNDYWMFVSSSGQSSKLLGTTAGTYGTEVSLTNNTFPIATGPNTIGDSLLTMIASGTTLAFNTNKFTIDSTDGSTTIAGNLTLSFSGGTDNGSSTSAVVFKNNSNVIGFVSTTASTVETAGLLGYRQSNGALIFSDLIDGGSY